MKLYSDEIALFTAKDATGTSLSYCVKDYQHLMLTLSSASSANFTIKFQGSMSDVVPDFSAAQSNTNRWDYISTLDLEDKAAIDGDTGVAFAGTDDVRQFEANVNGLKWFAATITARSAGTVSLRLQCFSNA